MKRSKLQSKQRMRHAKRAWVENSFASVPSTRVIRVRLGKFFRPTCQLNIQSAPLICSQTLTVPTTEAHSTAFKESVCNAQFFFGIETTRNVLNLKRKHANADSELDSMILFCISRLRGRRPIQKQKKWFDCYTID